MKIDRKKIEQAALDSNLGYSTSHYDSFIEGVEWTLAQVKNCSIPDVVGQSEHFFCCKDQIDQRCSEQCLGCFQFENKD